MITLFEVILTILMYCIGPLILGFLLSLISKRVLGILLLFLVYVLLVALWPGTSAVHFAGSFSVDSLAWFFAFYLVPALLGYGVGLIITRRGKVPKTQISETT